MKHIIINLIILWIGIGLWVGNRKIERHIRNQEPTYSDYLYRLHLITGKSEYELFRIAAEESGNFSFDEHFSAYVETGCFPEYMTKWLDEGKPYIKEARVKTWVW